MNNYQVVSDFINRILTKRYQLIENYLENILNSPSTINRIIKYYRVGYSEDYSKMYLLFRDTIIRKYGISLNDYHREQQLELWIEMSLHIHCEPVMPPFK